VELEYIVARTKSNLTQRAVWTGIVIAAASCMLLFAGCSQSGSDSSGTQHVGAVEAHPDSPELLDHSYGYLVRDDHEFARLAPNYSTLRPFTPDTSIVIETRSQTEGVESPAADFKEYINIRVHRKMPVRVVIADSTGAGLIVYDLKDQEPGAYTVGSKGWPVPQVELCKDLSWVYVYVVGDTRFRWRERFRLDKDRNLVPLAPSQATS